MEMPSDPTAKTRVRIAFFGLFVSMVALSFGAYFLANFERFQERSTAGEDQALLQGITDASQLEEALGRHPSNRLLQAMAMATRAANETRAAVEMLSSQVEPPALSKNINLGTAGRGDIEARRRDLKTAEANAATFMPRYVALFKTERDKVESYALSLHLEKDSVAGVLDGIDKRQAKIAAFTSRMLSARADYYRAYERYVAVLAEEFGTYKFVNGEFIFQLQRTVDRYNAAAQAMTAAAKRVAELEEEKKRLQPLQEGPEQIVHGK